MATDTVSGAAADTERRASWIPIVAILLAQLLLVLNVTMLKVSIEDIAESLSAASSWVKSAIVAYALSVAALITTGAKLDELFGVRRMFRVGVLVFAASMAAMALSRNVHSMIVAQIVAGAATGALAPALVILVTDNYRGNQRATAMGWLAAAQAMSIVPGILLAGLLATWPGWRYAYGVFILLALGVYALSEKVVAGRGRQRVSIDVIGVLLAAMAVYLIGTGCNNLYDWGAWRASEREPFGRAGGGGGAHQHGGEAGRASCLLLRARGARGAGAAAGLAALSRRNRARKGAFGPLSVAEQGDLARGEIHLGFGRRACELLLRALALDGCRADRGGHGFDGPGVRRIAVAGRCTANVGGVTRPLDGDAITLLDLALVRHDARAGSVGHRDRVGHAAAIAFCGRRADRSDLRAQRGIADGGVAPSRDGAQHPSDQRALHCVRIQGHLLGALDDAELHRRALADPCRNVIAGAHER